MAAHDGGAEAAVARYRELRRRYETSGAFDFGEWETNVVAEQLEEEGLLEEAIAVYTMNAEFHPESTGTWSGIGRIYEKMGRTEDALAAYEHALTIDPRAWGVQERIDALKE